MQIRQENASPFHHIAETIARRLIAERLLADEHEAERVLVTECERAGISSDETRARVVALVIDLLGANAKPIEPEPAR